MTTAQIDLGNGVGLTISPQFRWVVTSGAQHFALDDINDFYRAWRLLEMPFDFAIAALDRAANAAAPAFPLWKLLACALASGSLHWTELATAWVPHLPEAERAQLKPFLIALRDAKWPGQRLRHLARRYVSEIERGG